MPGTILAESLNLQVSTNTFGSHSLYYPGNASYAPTINYGTIHSFTWTGTYLTNGTAGLGGCFAVAQWCNIEQSAGVYTWTNLDAFISGNSGKDIIVNLAGTPAFYVASPGTNWVFADLSGNKVLGSNMPPDSLTNWTNYCTAIATKYGNSIYYEIWNEPSFTGVGTFTGTATQLATMARLAYQAIKAVAPSSVVLSPAFNTVGAMSQFMTASDGAGGTGSQWFDVLAFHFYNNAGQLQVEMNLGFINGITSLLKAAGRSGVPIWNTESGPLNATMSNFTASEKIHYLRKYIGGLLALGVQRFSYYAADNSWGLKNPPDTGANWDMSAAWNAIYSSIVGKTIVSSSISPNGYNYYDWSVTLNFSDGTSWTV